MRRFLSFLYRHIWKLSSTLGGHVFLWTILAWTILAKVLKKKCSCEFLFEIQLVYKKKSFKYFAYKPLGWGTATPMIILRFPCEEVNASYALVHLVKISRDFWEEDFKRTVDTSIIIWPTFKEVNPRMLQVKFGLFYPVVLEEMFVWIKWNTETHLTGQLSKYWRLCLIKPVHG